MYICMYICMYIDIQICIYIHPQMVTVVIFEDLLGPESPKK